MCIRDRDYIASRDFSDKEYSDIVVEAKRYFTRGDLFEVVPSYSFNEPCVTSPSVISVSYTHLTLPTSDLV